MGLSMVILVMLSSLLLTLILFHIVDVLFIRFDIELCKICVNNITGLLILLFSIIKPELSPAALIVWISLIGFNSIIEEVKYGNGFINKFKSFKLIIKRLWK